jgi:ABC-type transporter Mla subunit MlaD
MLLEMMRFRPGYLVLFVVCWHLSSCRRAPQRVVLVEFEQAVRIHQGTELRYRGVPVGRVESVTFSESQKKPLARCLEGRCAPAQDRG